MAGLGPHSPIAVSRVANGADDFLNNFLVII
jgi:hypothetical protein